EIQFRLRWRHYTCRHRLRFSAKIFKLQLRAPKFGEHRLDQLTIGLRQALLEQARGDANDQAIFLCPLQTCGAKPGGEAVGIYATFGVQKDFIPEVHRANLPFATISTDVEM